MSKQNKVMAEGIDTDNEKIILQEMGIEQHMIDYLMQQKEKNRISERWK